MPDTLTHRVPYSGRDPRYRGADRRIFDQKMLHGGGHSLYARRRVREQPGVDLREQSCGAVCVRARDVAAEYEAYARTLDQRYHDVRAVDVLAGRAQPGPILSRLREFPPCGGTVWGAYAEASHEVHELISHAATIGSELRWRRMGARSPAEARGFLVAAMRREWSVSAWLCQSRLVAWRLSTVGVPQLPPRAPRAAAPAGPQAEQWRADDADLAARFLQGLAPAVIGGGPRLA